MHGQRHPVLGHVRVQPDPTARHVDLEAEEDGKKVTYTIVGEDEADLKLGLINISSPIARALIAAYDEYVAHVATCAAG